MSAEEKKELSVEAVSKRLQKVLKEEYGVEVDANKFKGVAYTALKEMGALSEQDKYKTYDHVSKIKKTLNEAFRDSVGVEEEVFTFEDVEGFTGNLMYTMRVATARPIKEIDSLIASYQDKKNDGKLDVKTVVNDMYMLQRTIKQNMNDTWAHFEKIQQSGFGVFVNKTLRFVIDKIRKNN